MKTKKIIKEADQLLKKIEGFEKREKYLESLDFELQLVDDLLVEINRKKINEGFLDFLQNMVDGFAKVLGAGLKEAFGVSDEKINSSRAAAFKAAGKKPYKLEPDKKPDDLIMWASSQGFATDNLTKAKEGMAASTSLETPIPDQSNEDEMEQKWGKGGESAVAMDTLTKSGGYILATVQLIAEKEPALKELKPVWEELNSFASSDGNENGAIGILKAWELGVGALTEGAWAKAMRKAEELSEEKKWFNESDLVIDAETPIKLAKEIQSHVKSEISRLEAALSEMQANQGEEKESGEEATGSEEAPTGVF